MEQAENIEIETKSQMIQFILIITQIIHFGEIDLDHDHGRTVYEIEIFYNNSKYEFDIDASTSEIVGTEVKHYNKNY